jgi:transcriptional regulator with XRE-family HTH domain
VNLDEFDQAGREQLGRRIDQARRRLGLTLDQVGRLAGYDAGTISKAINGERVRSATLHDICKAVEIDAYENRAGTKIASAEYGGYNLEHYRDYVGWFYSYRRSFSFSGSIIRSIFEFRWSEERKCLTFREIQKYKSPELGHEIDYSQEGDIFISNTNNLIHLLTKNEGALRLVTLTKMREADQVVRGIVLTQAPGKGDFYYQPSVSAIYFKKIDGSPKAEELVDRLGPIKSPEPDFLSADRMLIDIEQRLGRFAIASTI